MMMIRSRLLGAGLIAAAIAPAAARAQAAEDRGAFLMLAGNDTALVERFARSPGGVQAEAGIPGRARIVYSLQTGADQAVTGMELRVWSPGAPDSLPPLQHAVLTWAGDSAVASIDAGGQHLTRVVHGARGAVPIVNPCVVMIEQLVMRARALGGRDSVMAPFFVLGAGDHPVRATVRWIGADSAVVALGPTELRARIDAAGHILGAAIASQHVTILRVANAAAVAMPRPDYSPPVGAPYTAEEVVVPHPAGFRLAGTLTLPKVRAGRVPAVVTITGSGLEDRDEAISIVPGYRPFRQVADTLTRRGIAVLRMDDRGFGGSGGDPLTATTQDFVGDIAAAVAYLRSRPEIDPDRIALVGHSEGGIIAPLLAVADPRVRAIALLAGTSRTGRRVLEDQFRFGVNRDTTVSAARRDSAYRAAWATVDSMAAHVPWLPFFMTYDPSATARRVRQPVLILQGATDRQVTADQAPELAAAFRAGGNRDVTLRVFPGLDHLFLPDPTGDPATYGRLPSTKIPSDVLGVLADWLADKLK